MAAVDPKTKTTYATTDWNHYQQGRPPYPPSLTELILNYHRRHQRSDPDAGNTAGSGWDRLVDIGAGSGVAATNFMPYFKTLHISDPSAANLDQARTFLADFARRHGHDPVLEYSQSTGELAHEPLLSRGERADLAICATAAHFIDPDGLAASAGALLRPGGTLAVFSYWMPSFPGRSARFHDAFAGAFDAVVLRALLAREEQPAADPSRTRLARVVRRRMTGRGVLDSLPVPMELFDDPVRVYINGGDEIAMSGLFRRVFAPADGKLGGESRVGERDAVVQYSTGTDPEADGWEFEVDKKWIATFWDTIRPPGQETKEARAAYAGWERVFGEECPGGRVKVNWPAYLVLASRK